MTTTADHTVDTHADAHADGEHTHHSDAYYIKVALFLAVLTALETATYWVDLGPFFLPSLLIMMAIKFFMVVLVFMHLGEEPAIFKMLFYAGLGLAIGVYTAALAAFHFFS